MGKDRSEGIAARVMRNLGWTPQQTEEYWKNVGNDRADQAIAIDEEAQAAAEREAYPAQYAAWRNNWANKKHSRQVTQPADAYSGGDMGQYATDEMPGFDK